MSQDDYNSDENGWENELHSTTKNSVHEKGISTQLINNARDKIVNNNNTSSITDLEGDQLISSVISTRNRERRSMSNDEDSSSEDYATSSEIQETSTYSDITNVQPDSDCSIHELYVDFEKIGWASWIISPKGYNASYCKGKCSFPLGQNQRPTNHATVQSIVHELRLHDGIEMPCCVPNKLFSISLLYFEGNGNVVLKQYEEMAAASCGCH